ncbi:hypothetical protein [Neokomagataea anthophila]|uniref:Uncharacterized protein n=1 Tax=Neokomagataea anthophila TaxID=2826925 RepID=A0ABS5E754_9PROT|nr:hypothetical protein [Neokomagataea anthophila]MBR0559736.1 hypothetical protein [Neokomagataea anthophila]
MKPDIAFASLFISKIIMELLIDCIDEHNRDNYADITANEVLENFTNNNISLKYIKNDNTRFLTEMLYLSKRKIIIQNIVEIGKILQSSKVNNRYDKNEFERLFNIKLNRMLEIEANAKIAQQKSLLGLI